MTDWLQTASPASAARPAHESAFLNLNERRLALDGEAYTFEEFATRQLFGWGFQTNNTFEDMTRTAQDSIGASSSTTGWPLNKNRSRCQCHGGCRKKPGRRVNCDWCGQAIGPCCIAHGDAIRVFCHWCKPGLSEEAKGANM